MSETCSLFKSIISDLLSSKDNVACDDSGICISLHNELNMSAKLKSLLNDLQAENLIGTSENSNDLGLMGCDIYIDFKTEDSEKLRTRLQDYLTH